MNVEMWAIYDHPSDYPHGFIARKWVIESSLVRATQDIVVGPTLQFVRQRIPVVQVRIPRFRADDPRIVEVWV
jgi:hypothetical protein